MGIYQGRTVNGMSSFFYNMKNQDFGFLVNFCIYGILKTVSAYAIMPIGKIDMSISKRPLLFLYLSRGAIIVQWQKYHNKLYMFSYHTRIESL